MSVGDLWTDFRKRVREAADGRSLAGTATAAGLPRNAIRDVLLGHEPRLARAAEVAKALGFRLELTPRKPGGDRPSGEVTLSAEQYRRLREGFAVLDELDPLASRRSRRRRR